MRQPTIFIPHGGGPCFFMEWNPPHAWDKTAAWLKGLLDEAPERPRAILVVSGHWEERAFTAGSAEHPPLIYDYYGFPEHTYRLTFAPPGSPQLAARVRELLDTAGLPAGEDPGRGYDHGVFIPFKLVLPQEDIPVVQLSLHSSLDPAVHLAAGRALAPLRDEGVLIVGSGMSWHNLRAMHPGATAVSEVFDRWLSQVVTDSAERDAALLRWSEAPYARVAHPREEHLAPLFVVAGAAEGEPARHAFRDIAMDVAISGFVFGETAAPAAA